MRWKLLAVLALIGGPGLAYAGWRDKAKLARIEREGVTVTGRLMDGETQSGRRGAKSYYVNVAYNAGGQDVVGRFKITRSYFDRIVKGNMIVADTAEIRYLPTDVNTAIIVGGSDDDTILFPIGLVVAGLGVIGIVFWIRGATRK